MSDEGDSSTANTATSNRGTAVAQSITFRIRMDVWAFDQEVIDRIKRSLKIDWDSTYEELNFRAKLRGLQTSFEIARPKSRYITIVLTPRRGYTWAAIRDYPALLYDHVRVQHEVQVEDERRATADRLAKDASAERERQRAEQKIASIANTIGQKTISWTKGKVYGRYTKNDFEIEYFPYESAKTPPRVAPTPNQLQFFQNKLWMLYSNAGYRMEVYTIGDFSLPMDEAALPLDNWVDFDEGEAEAIKIKYLHSTFASTSQDLLMAAIPASGTDVAVAAIVPFTPKLFKALNKFRKAGKLWQIIRMPLRVRQLSRPLAKTGRIDPELLRMAWRFRYGEVGSAEKAFYRNFMAARVTVKGETKYVKALNVKASPYHSEDELIVLKSELRKELGWDTDIEVTQIFTERIPCTECRIKLDTEFPSAQIYYVSGRGPDRAEELFNYYFDASKL